MDEDCQNLNIWTPACDDKKRPVMVWLHGGGFEAGSAIEQIAYEGENMSRLGGVVVVSINHRLNVLGYCDLSDFGEEYANSGNAGTDDIIAALSWIQKNIAVFTGDPNNGAIPQWQPSTPEEEHTILFSEDTKVVVNHDKELIPLAAKYVGPILAKAMGKAEIQH